MTFLVIPSARRSASRPRIGLRLAAASIAAALGVGMAAAPAQAADPRPENGAGTVAITSALTVERGNTITFEGSGFVVGGTSEAPVGQTLSIKVDDVDPVVGTVQVEADGGFEGTVTVPVGLANGEHWLRFLAGTPAVSKHTQKFTVVDELPDATDVTVAVSNGGRGNPAGTVTASLSGQSFVAGESLTAKIDGVATAWTAAPTVGADGKFTGARIVFTPGQIRAGDHTIEIVRSAPGAENVQKAFRVEPTTTFSSLARGTAGTLTLVNLPSSATISAITLGDLDFATPVTSDVAGTATVDYEIPNDAALGTLPLSITQSAPTAQTYTGSAKVSPSAALIGVDDFTSISTPAGVIEQGLYQSAYSAKSDALFVATASTTVTSTIYKLDPKTLAVEASVVPAFVTGNSGALWAAYGIGVDDRNDTVWVTNTRQNTIAVYSQSDLSLIQQFPTGTLQHSRDVIVDTERNKVIISSAAEGTSGEGYVDVYDGTTRALLKRVETGLRTEFSPMSLDLDAKNGVVYTVSNSQAKAAAIDISGDDYPVKFINLDLPTGAKASGAAFDAATNRLWVASQGTDGITVIDVATGNKVKEVATGAGSLNVVIDPVHRLVYVANFGGTTVTVLDQAGTIVANLPVARANHIETDGLGSVFVVNKDTGNQVFKLTPKNIRSATPVVAGTAKVGGKLQATAGTWSKGTALSYQWKRNGVAISGAKASSYSPAAADANRTITVSVTGALAGYPAVTKTSAGKKIAVGTLTSAKPRISGKAKVGKTLKVVRGSWTSGTSFSYKWYANGKAVKGATKSTLKLKKAQKGKRITVKVTGKKTGYATVAKTSSKTSKVAKK